MRVIKLIGLGLNLVLGLRVLIPGLKQLVQG